MLMISLFGLTSSVCTRSLMDILYNTVHVPSKLLLWPQKHRPSIRANPLPRPPRRVIILTVFVSKFRGYTPSHFVRHAHVVLFSPPLKDERGGEGNAEGVTERLPQFTAVFAGAAPKIRSRARNEVVYEEEAPMLNLPSRLALLIPFATTRTLEASPRERVFFRDACRARPRLSASPFYGLHLRYLAFDKPGSCLHEQFSRRVSLAGESRMSTALRQQ